MMPTINNTKGGDFIKEKRLVQLVCAMIAFAFIIELNMVKIMCGDYYLKAQAQDIKTIDVSAGRADIVDCNLRNITGSQSQIMALVTRQSDLQEIFENIRDEDKPKFYNQIKDASRAMVSLESPIQSDMVYLTSKRYTSTNSAQHLIGYTDLDGNGLTGIEKAFDEKLKEKGEKISLKLNVNGEGQIYGDITTEITVRPQVLSLTVDNTLQRMAEAVAKEYITNGSIVIMESKTGKIRAMASVPIYDANNVADYLSDENSPLVNKALSVYEPGSVIKPLWAAAMLESGADPNETYYCKGYTEVAGHVYHCANDRAHGQVDMNRALTVSCNCYFIDKYIKNKSFVLKQMANQVDIGSSIRLCENYYTAKGSFPTIDEIKNLGQLSSVCFGQGSFLLTPIHVISYMNIFANEGVYISPQIAQGIYDGADESLVENLYSYNPKRVITQQTAEQIKEMLVNVVNEGAGGRAKPSYLDAAGKTGTAQTGKFNEDGEEILTAWFCGFYPAQEPRYTICITMYDGGESTYTTTPIFKKICDELYYLLYSTGNSDLPQQSAQSQASEQSN